MVSHAVDVVVAPGVICADEDYLHLVEVVGLENFFLESAASMRANQGIQISSNISINDFKLDEATSFDGRNMFFPAEGYFTTTTANMKFRDGNVGDRNVRYVYKDFTLSNSSSKTNVFIKGYKIQIGDQTYQDEIEIKYENGKPKFKNWDFALQPSFMVRTANHWKWGIEASIGLRNMLKQYPQYKVSGSTRFVNLMVSCCRVF